LEYKVEHWIDGRWFVVVSSRSLQRAFVFKAKLEARKPKESYRVKVEWGDELLPTAV